MYQTGFGFISIVLLNVLFVKVDGQNDRPKILEIALPKTIEEGSELRLSCDIHQDSKLPVNFEWTINDKKLEPSKEVVIKNREDESRLIIKSVSIEHLGSVKCKATNQVGQDSQTVNLFFNVKPKKWIQEPGDLKVKFQSRVNIPCNVLASPKPTIRWSHLDKNGSILKNFDTNILSLTVNQTSVGKYKCIGFNALGSLEKVISVSYYAEHYTSARSVILLGIFGVLGLLGVKCLLRMQANQFTQ